MTTPQTDSIGEVLWQPDQLAIDNANISLFINNISGLYKEVSDYDSLYQWSVKNPELFWQETWSQFEVIFSQPATSVLQNPQAMPGARWFPGAKLNYAENMLRFNDETTAIIFRQESGEERRLSYRALRMEVARYAYWLRQNGVRKGDRVGAYMANMPETIIAFLATASIGAIWSSCSPDFGVKGVMERFVQIEPKVLFTIDGYHYNGKSHDVISSAAQVVEQIQSIEKIVVVPLLDSQPDIGRLAATGRDIVLSYNIKNNSQDIEFEQLSFDYPLYILYSSGTTGAPKCIVHSAGGSLLQHLKEHRLHCDVGREDKLFYFTTCGWMMWNWLVSGLASGCTLVLYEGSPFFPRRRSLWQFAEEVGITVFGTSARYLAACSKARLVPAGEYDLSKLRAILSTGSPLAPESFDYVYSNVKKDVMLSSISGGTDIVSCFVLGNPTRPVRRGEIQCRGLGMAVDVFVDGQSAVGRRGELVCTRPFPSMPIGFWGEPDDSRYIDAYFSRFDQVWAQGDYAEITQNDGVIIYGRSDAVLNPGGVRIGTAEIYRQVEKVDAVLESICIGQIWSNDVRIVLFVILRDGVELDASLKAEIRKVIKENTTSRHLPKKIIAVPDIPRTLSGKIVELAVRNIVHGDPVKNTDALANPEALEHFRDLPELQEN
ncbi:MAG: acetoacetate--CoA ligase [Acidiferrobacterales bacterium]|nr:acetoacetate--CoA ligase [Acidiferrobacterales bacterium]